MNLPDITLFLQIFHFGVAFVVLRTFVFAPALALLQADDARKEQLENKVVQAQKKYQDLLASQKQRWNFICKSLRDMIPQRQSAACDSFQGVSAPIPVEHVTLSNKQKDEISQVVRKELLEI